MKVDKELFEFQDATIEQYRKAVDNVRERFTVSRTLNKHLNTILSHLETYEIMYAPLVRVREVSSAVMKSEELETIEGEMKVLNDTFWK